MGIQSYRIQGIQRNRIQMGIQRGIQEDTWGHGDAWGYMRIQG